jgi:hypothetical protein
MTTGALLLAAGIAAPLPGCAGDSCDPDQTLLPAGICFETNLLTTTVGADAGGEEDGGAPDGGTCAPFGYPCSTTDDCICETNICILRTTSDAEEGSDADGVCTHTGCLSDPAICPSGWTCVDLSPYGAGLPSICIPPS